MHRQYEITFIVDAYLTNEQIEEKIQNYTQSIENAEGKIIRLERWGKRRLAYEIAKKQYGFYVYVRLEAPGTIVQIIEREFKLDDDILRYLTIQLTPAALKEEARQANIAKLEAENDNDSDEKDVPSEETKKETTAKVSEEDQEIKESPETKETE